MSARLPLPAPLAASDVATASRASRREAVTEFFLTGGATLVLFPFALALRHVLGLDAAELAVGFTMFHAAHVINDPHFTVTYLLFYERAKERAWGQEWGRAQRIRYWIAGALVPLVLLAWAGGALFFRSAEGLGALIQLMFLLVGFHYVKQGFGLLMVMSARRGFFWSSRERRVLLLHCFTGWAYAWSRPAHPARLVEESGVVYTSVAVPRLLELITAALFCVSALGLAFVLFLKWQKERRFPPLAPLAGFLVTIWAWTVFSDVDPLFIYMIPALHSVQYLYFVHLLEKNQAVENEHERLGPPVRQRLWLVAATAIGLGVVFFHALPGLLDGALVPAPRDMSERDLLLGATPYFAAFFTCINIHHYAMDQVIWRRDNPKTRYLTQR